MKSTSTKQSSIFSFIFGDQRKLSHFPVLPSSCTISSSIRLSRGASSSCKGKKRMGFGGVPIDCIWSPSSPSPAVKWLVAPNKRSSNEWGNWSKQPRETTRTYSKNHPGFHCQHHEFNYVPLRIIYASFHDSLKCAVVRTWAPTTCQVSTRKTKLYQQVSLNLRRCINTSWFIGFPMGNKW